MNQRTCGTVVSFDNSTYSIIFCTLPFGHEVTPERGHRFDPNDANFKAPSGWTGNEVF